MATSTELPPPSPSAPEPAARSAVPTSVAEPPVAEPTGAEPSVDENAPPALAEGVELLGEVPGSGYRQAPSLVRRGDGQTLQLTPLLYAVLESIDGRRSYEGIAELVSERVGKLAGADDIRFLVRKKLTPLGVLQGADGAAPAPAPKANPLLALKPRVAITDPARTRRITTPFARLFAPPVVIPLLLAFVAATIWLMFQKGLASATHQAFYQPGLLLVVFALTVVSGGFHEFGHAAACRRVGATPGTMGFGLYIVWPAFYTDVTDSYRLGRWQRLWVDLGGIYFNAVFAVLSYAAWAVTRWDALLLVGGLQLLQMLRQLSPVIRADGYHILADLTGVPDLFAHIGPTIRSILPSQWRRRDTRTLKRWARVLVIAWVLLIVPSLVFALVSGAVLLPRLVATALDSMAEQWHLLTDGISALDVPKALLAAVKLVAVGLPVLGTVLMLGRVVLRTGRRVWASTQTSRPRRVVALLTAAAMLAGLAWAWWPRDQYQPIRGNEGGRITQLGTVLRAASTGTAGRPLAGPVVRARNGMVRQSALLLVPRRGATTPVRPALMLLPGAPGASPQLVAIPPAPTPGGTPSAAPSAPAETGAAAWPFPFAPPAPQREGDNRAITINTTDGTAVYDVAFAVVWVGGQDVTQRNEAIALAECRNCRTVSVAFQAVFLIGRSAVVTPVNTSLAVNNNCDNCETAAIAVQLVTSLTAVPDRATMAQLDDVWRQLDRLAGEIPNLSVTEIYGRLSGIQSSILTILTSAGPDVLATGQQMTTPAATPAPGASAGVGPNPPGSAAGGTAGSSPASPAPVASGTGTQDGATPPGSSSAPSSTPAPGAPPSPAPSPSTGAVGAPDPTATTGTTDSTATATGPS